MAVGAETIVGRTGVALGRLDPAAASPAGQVRVEGEIWAARSAEPIEPGAPVRGQRGARRSCSRWSRTGDRDRVVEPAAVALLKLTLEYDGGAFRGWARQPGQRTVEGALREALDAIYPRGWDGLAVAGRTDTGVHATGQVASVEVTGGAPAAKAAEALNTALPPDVSVLLAEDAPGGFNARFSATGRSYRYLVLNRVARSALEAKRSLWWPRPVDLERLQASARASSRRARVHGLHARRDPARGVRADRSGGGVGAPRRSSPLHRHRRLVPPAHGAHPRRDDAAGRPGADRAPARGPAAIRGRGDGAALGPLPRAGRVSDGARGRTEAGRRSPDTIDHALPRHPLRPRRNPDRLGPDHRRLDASRLGDRARAGARRGPGQGSNRGQGLSRRCATSTPTGSTS